MQVNQRPGLERPRSPLVARTARRTIAGVTLIAALGILSIATAASAGAADARGAASSDRIDAILELHHPAGLKRFARQVSNPVSPRYRRYSSVGKLTRRFGASDSDRRRVKRWLRNHELGGAIGATGTFALVRLSSGDAAAFGVSPGVVASLAAGTARAVQGAVPTAIRGSVRSVTLLDTSADGLETPFAARAQNAAASAGGPAAIPPSAGATNADAYDSAQPRTGAPAGCAEGQEAGGPAPFFGFTPNQYLTAYGYDTLHRRGLRGQGHRVSVVEIDGFRRTDIEAFADCFGLPSPPIRTHLVGIDKPLPPGIETTLDLEALTAAAPGLKSIDVYEGDGSFAGVIESMAAALGEPRRRPTAISVSLGACEPEVGRRAIRRAFTDVAALAAGAGISITVASGDDGSSGCTSQGEALPLLAVSIPASLPYVTAIGGTNLILDADNEIEDEIVWSTAGFDSAGGGGRSVLFNRQFWQHGPRGRGSGVRLVPDIAALADIVPGYAIYCTASACQGGEPQHPGWIPIGGTSAATPLLAGAMVLLSQHAERHGQAPIGSRTRCSTTSAAASGGARSRTSPSGTTTCSRGPAPASDAATPGRASTWHPAGARRSSR